MNIGMKAYLEDVCKRINSDGFYLGVISRKFASDLQYEKKCILDGIIRRYSDFLSYKNAISCISPHNELVMLCHAKAGIFRAYPIWNGIGIERFFSKPSFHTKCINGIVIISHKMKMLSLVIACYDFVQYSPSHYSLWLNEHAFVEEWRTLGMDLKKLDCLESSWHLENNYMHVKYQRVFELDYDIMPIEICFSIEDHYENDLLIEKIHVANEIRLLTHGITQAKRSIELYNKDIAMANDKISALQNDLEKYEIDLYASRINTDLDI